MNCPIDASELRITERQGIEIDYCPKCRGVWLDRGELDKLIERAAPDVSSERQPLGAWDEPRSARGRPSGREWSSDQDREWGGRYERDRDDDDDYRPRKKSKRRSLLEEIFDID